MKAVKKHPRWLAFESRVHALSLRERIIMLGLLITLLVGGVDQLWLDPGFKRLTSLQKNIQDARRSIILSQEQVVMLAEQRARDPDQEVRTELDALAARKLALDGEIENVSGQFVSPARMPKVLSALLETYPGLQLTSVEALPVVEVSMGAGEQAVKLYEHSLKLSFKGGFMGLYDYLRAVESLDQSLIWDRLQFSMARYPVGDIELVVKTLGTGKEFIGVYR